MKITELQEGVEYYGTFFGQKSTNKYKVENGELVFYNRIEHIWMSSDKPYNEVVDAEFEPCEWVPKMGGLVYYPNPWSPTAIDSEIYRGRELDLRLMSRLGFYRTAEEAIAKAKSLGWT